MSVLERPSPRHRPVGSTVSLLVGSSVSLPVGLTVLLQVGSTVSLSVEPGDVVQEVGRVGRISKVMGN